MSSRMRFYRQIITAGVAINTLSDELSNADLVACNELVYYIVFGALTSAGAVQIETAHVSGYSGTWAAEGSPAAWSAATKVSTVRVQGASYVSRARISTGVVGGSVDVFVMGLD
jgi:hypothetical protein